MHDEGPGARLDEFHRQMRDGAGPHRGIVVLARVAPQQVDQFAHRTHAEIRRDRQHIGLDRRQRDRCQIPKRIVGHGLVEHRVVDQRPGDRDTHGIAVGRGLGHRIGTDVAARPGLVVDDDRLAQRASQAIGDQSGQHVGRAARREGHDQFHCPARPIRLLRQGHRGQAGRGADQMQHVASTEVGQIRSRFHG